ncbi:NRDE family protein [Halomonas huangheensis]|uniref:NRDE family protein n=1 Tax=Halomonas huangheensis TaxID=1178482 RepID=W1N3V3_9GAMM|nr:NRDE family protein [Halomonas huangheensis]ALM51692.1 hypothetical protein AR456_04870 [Halomonas huangheensis]ERL50184.1 hypothetical protein BJB45_03390 [Halomonas huangheensis]
MCLIAFHFAPGTPTPLVLVGNRDEQYSRATAPLATWTDHPEISGGRDLQAGGSWLAVHQSGRFAALTNVRDPEIIISPNPPSRGQLVRDALLVDDLHAWLQQQVAGAGLAFGGFNLLVGNAQQLWHLGRNRRGMQLATVSPGTHGLSNASLNSHWPKLCKVREALRHDVNNGDAASLLLPASLTNFSDPGQAPDEKLPDTGVGLELERFLSSAFIVGDDYGTRSTTRLALSTSGAIPSFHIIEQRFGVRGQALGETRLQIAGIEHASLEPVPRPS